MLAVVRIRGRVNVSEEISRTLEYLHLPARNSCTLIPDNPHYKGMLQKVKDYVTWGPLNEQGAKAILNRIETTEEKKPDAKAILEKPLSELKVNSRIRLHPPRGGLKSVLHPYPDGDLGNRGEEINGLLVKMR